VLATHQPEISITTSWVRRKKQRGMAAEEGENELIEDLIKFRENHLKKIRKEKWKKIQEKIEKAKKKNCAQQRKNLFH
jgi:ribosome recycling factor